MSADPARTHIGSTISTLWLAALYKRSLHFRCRACPHERLLDAIPVWWRFDRRNWNQSLRHVPERFYCAECWGARIKKVRNPLLRISEDRAPPCGLPYPSEREWKRMVARYRA